jgi:hypothetical protein
MLIHMFIPFAGTSEGLPLPSAFGMVAKDFIFRISRWNSISFEGLSIGDIRWWLGEPVKEFARFTGIPEEEVRQTLVHFHLV